MNNTDKGREITEDMDLDIYDGHTIDLEALYNEHKDSGTYESLFEGKALYERG